MRRILILAFLLISTISKSQFTRGDKVLSGKLSYINDNGELTSSNRKSLTISPRFGFLVNENFEIGGQIVGGYSKQEYSQQEYENKSISLGIYGQRYFTITDKFLFSIIGELNFTRGQNIYPVFDPFLGETIVTKSNNNTLSISIIPNFTFFPSPKWGFAASIGTLGYSNFKDLSTKKTANFTYLDLGYLSFGVSYYFRENIE